jgi:hypothetical protein
MARSLFVAGAVNLLLVAVMWVTTVVVGVQETYLSWDRARDLLAQGAVTPDKLHDFFKQRGVTPDYPSSLPPNWNGYPGAVSFFADWMCGRIDGRPYVQGLPWLIGIAVTAANGVGMLAAGVLVRRQRSQR